MAVVLVGALPSSALAADTPTVPSGGSSNTATASSTQSAKPSKAPGKSSAPSAGKGKAQAGTARPATTNPLLSGMATAMAKAKKTHKPVQVDVATNPYTTLTANPAGHFTAQEFLNPQRAKVGGSWKPIDTTLVKNADGSVRSKVTLASVKLSGGGSGPLAVVDDGAGHVLTFTWPGGALPAPTLSGATATYANVYPGVDLNLVALPTGVQDVLVVHNAKAAANPALKSIRLGVTGQGLSVGSTSAGGVTAKDAKGHEVFGGPAPAMWDSSGAPAPGAATGKDAPHADAAASPHMAKMQVAVAHGSVTVTPDQSMLTSKSTVWPVEIDPQWVENPQNWLELWSNGNSVYDGNPWPYSGYDTSAVRVGNSAGTLVRSLMSFSAFNLPKPPDFSAYPGDQSKNVTFVTGAFLNLISQSATCPSTQAWRANQFNTGSNWSNQNGGSDTNLWPTSGSDFTNPISTFGGSTNCKNNWFSVNITQQVRDVYNAGGGTYTIGLRAANEGSTTNNYGSYFVQNAGGNNPNVTVNFVSEPWWGTPSVTNTPIGNHSGSKNPCGSTQQTAGYLPVQAANVGISIPLNDLDSRQASWALMLDDYPGGPQSSYYAGTLTTGYGYQVAPTTVTGQMLTQVSPTGGNGFDGSPVTLQDGHTYGLWGQALDDEWMTNGTFVNPNGQDLYNAWNNNGNPYPAPASPKCWFTAALTPPNQPTVTQSTFPATGKQLASYPTVGTGGTITINATAPTTGIDHFDWALNTTSTNEGAGNCTGIANAACGTVNASASGTSGLGTTNATVPITLASGAGDGEHWGTNYLYVSAVDKAGNVSAYMRYDFFLAQAFQPVSFGNVSGDGTPNLMGADKNGNLIIYPTNLDPAGSVNAVQAAPAASAPNGSSWSTALITHRGAERVQPTDDLFAFDRDSSGNGHLSYYYNSQTASASTQPGYTPPTTLNAFAQTQQAVVTRPSCTPGALNGGCVGYDPTWNSVQQIIALGPVRGGCTISLPTTACKTNLVTVESYQGNTRVWLFSPAGTGQVTNPVLLSVSQPGWDWSRMRVMAPGNAAGHPGGSGGMPDLWAEDPAGTLWQFTNHSDTGTLGAGLGDLSNKQQLGSTGQFAPYTWVNTAGDLNGDGNPDLWAMSPDGQVSVLLGPIGSNLASQGQTTATAINWGATAGVSNLQGTPITSGINGQIVNDVTGGPSGQKCVDDEYGSTANGTTIELYDCNGTRPQGWAFHPDGTIRFMGGDGQQNTCMDTSGSLVQATKVTLQACDLVNRASYQTWRIIPSPSAAGHYWIYNPAAGMCLDDSGASNSNLNPFQLWPCWDTASNPDPAQRFVLPTGQGQTQTVEAESTWGSVNGPATQIQGNCCGISLSNGEQLYFPGTAQNQSVTMNYFVANAGTYSVTAALTKTNDRGQVSVAVDSGTAQATTLPLTYDAYQASGVSIVPVHFGTVTLSAGMHSFTFTMTGTNAASVGNRYVIGIDTLSLVPTVGNGPSLGLNIPATGLTGVPVTADSTATYPGTTAVTGYSFDFGDGTVVGPQAAASASHTYTSTGTYTVKVTATDAGGVTATSSASVVVTGGATSQWKLSDGSGTTAADTGSPGGDAGTLSTSGVTWSPNGSAAFDGTGQITAAPSVDTSKSFSAAAWVNLRDTSTYHFVLAQAGTNMESFYLDYDPPQHSWAMVMPTSDNPGPGWTWAAAPASDVSLNTWTHLVGTFDATSGTIRLYVNGQLAGTGTTHAAWNSATKTGSALVIGASDRAGTLAYRFNGSIADARVYQQTLTPDQVSWLFQNSAFTSTKTSGSFYSPTLTGKCIDDYTANQTDGTHVNEWDCNGGSAQNWTLSPNGSLSLTASNGTKCLDITGGSSATANGTLVELWDCQGGANQQWVAQSDGNGNVHLLNPNSGRCLDDPGGSLSNGTQLQIYDCLGNANQAWTPPLGTNLAAGGVATASSQLTGWEATQLTDGIYRGAGTVRGYSSQKDSSANTNEWAQVDLGTTHQIGEVDLYPRDEAANAIGMCFPVTFTIQTSVDGTNWTTVANEVNYPKPGDAPQQFRFNATGARYVKVNATVLNADQYGDHYLQLRQIGVQGT
ncbi:ricin-type beta-trefoil lectin domain protein [Streptacidiphilus melanogenes]|uniref:ricin-type beta-trefoil lectin domain protein n=1 Tax=Streptacidiphilus melanogenes TaxID=411235 RepID=UPI0005A62EAE|nr:ricin-type beta-trefoil lectin domain protein [Streptacidiphilus melanogenes]